MLKCESFYRLLQYEGIGFFTGVPDSLLKYFCAYLSDHTGHSEHVIAANEGGAVALAAGHYLATGNPAMVYLQNSGQGNAVNPLMSLCDPEVYGIPMLLLVGWRGEPGVQDEPQHRKQGRVATALFDAMEIPHEILSSNSDVAGEQLGRMLELSIAQKQPVALVVRKETFDAYDRQASSCSAKLPRREEAIDFLVDRLPQHSVVVATTGHISRELYASRKRRKEGHEQDFLMVGGMGHASQVALGIALAQPERPVYCFDGDGAALMHMGGLALVGQSTCSNLRHVLFNNGAHGSVGGQPTVGLAVDLCGVARSCGYGSVTRALDQHELDVAGRNLVSAQGPAFLEVQVSLDFRPDLERPNTTPEQNKRCLMGFLDDS